MQGIAQQLFGARAKGIQVPTGLENLRKLRQLDVVLLSRLGLQDIQSDGELGIGWFDDNKPVAEIGSGPPLRGGYNPEQKRHGVAVKVKENEAVAAVDILRTEVAQEERLSLAGFAENSHVL